MINEARTGKVYVNPCKPPKTPKTAFLGFLGVFGGFREYLVPLRAISHYSST